MSQTTVKIIADSVHASDPTARITSFEIEYPRFILAEVNTHRIITKSTASSRAIPVAKRIKMVEDSPFIPRSFGKNKPGMQSHEEIEETEAGRELWIRASQSANHFAREMSALKVHKQTANRIIEPYVYVRTILTFTEFDNFYNLRTSAEAQPEFQELARMMREAHLQSTPRVLVPGERHMPYITDEERAVNLVYLNTQFSIARTARISYKTHDGKLPSKEADLALFSKLASSFHMSPFDHVAVAMNKVKPYRQYYGWLPYRAVFEQNTGMECSRLNRGEPHFGIDV